MSTENNEEHNASSIFGLWYTVFPQNVGKLYIGKSMSINCYAIKSNTKDTK